MQPNPIHLHWSATPVGNICNKIYIPHTYTHLTALFRDYPRWAGTRKAKTNLDLTEARDSEWQWHQLGHMKVCTSLQTDNHASTPPLSFLQAGYPSCRPINSVKALKTLHLHSNILIFYYHIKNVIKLVAHEMAAHNQIYSHAVSIIIRIIINRFV